MDSNQLRADDLSDNDLVSASELREFVFCERSWWFTYHGYAVPSAVRALRDDGIAFHAARAGAARVAKSKRELWLGILFLLAALIVCAASILRKVL